MFKTGFAKSQIKDPNKKTDKDWKVDDAYLFVAGAGLMKGWPSPRRPAAVVSGSAESVSGRVGMAWVAPFRLPGDIVVCCCFLVK